MGIGWAELIILVIPAACLGALVWLWVRVVRQLRGDLAQCGQCRYCIRGISTMACPECGAAAGPPPAPDS